MLFNNRLKSVNYSSRTKNIKYVILHYTEMEFDDSLQILTNKEPGVSAHYLIKEDGEIFSLVEDGNIAFHAGKSSWNGEVALNENSIGIELNNLGNEEFATKQIEACLELCKFLKDKYNIPQENFIGHSDIAPSRKIDPGIYFDWEEFAKHGFGIWHGINFKDIPSLSYLENEGLDIASLQKKLKSLGYNLEVNSKLDKQTNDVIRAFQSKFCPFVIKDKGINFYRNMESKYQWNPISNKILDALLQKAKK